MRAFLVLVLMLAISGNCLAVMQTTPPAPEDKPAQPPISKKKKKKKRVAKPGEPRRRIVRSGGATDSTPQMSPAVPESNASSQKQTTLRLLDSTEFNLKEAASRQPSATQQQTMAQIRVYMRQARQAIDDGDLTQGQNLATKAHVLSEDLLKQ